MKTTSFEAFEEIGIGVVNPKPVYRWTGPPEELERLLAFMLQSGYEVDGLTEEEKAKYLKIEVDI